MWCCYPCYFRTLVNVTTGKVTVHCKLQQRLYMSVYSIHVSTNKQSEAMLFLFWLHSKSVLQNLRVTVAQDTPNKQTNPF